MSELINAGAKQRDYHWQLLSTVSALALLGNVVVMSGAAASDDNDARPVVWVELGGQLERIDGGVERFAPSFIDLVNPSQLVPPTDLERSARYSNGGEGKITFQPEGSVWSFSAAVRYGRTTSKRHLHQEYDFPQHATSHGGSQALYVAPNGQKYFFLTPNVEDTATSERESHTIIDFQVGRDVGLGMFGGKTVSTFSFGVRMVQFSSFAKSKIYLRPDAHFVSSQFAGFIFHNGNYHNYYASAQMTRNSRAIGPSIEWNNSTPLVGNEREGHVNFDWSANAAVLFGRHKMAAHHQSSSFYRYGGIIGTHHTQRVEGLPVDIQRSRSVVTPDVGAVASVSYNVESFKFALGYRADLFFNAIDGGIDTRKSYNRILHGPFATINIGLGG